MRRDGCGPARVLAPLLGLAACASDWGPSVDRSGEGVEVVVLGAGFVQAGGRRQPLEAFVLELRQRLRALDEPRRNALWVKVGVDRDAGDAASAEVSRLLDELELMGVRQVVYL